MDIVDLREVVSSATHAAAFVIAVPATIILWNRAAGDRNRQISFLVYGIGLMACFGASTLCHASGRLGHPSSRLILIDHLAIFLLIAGTYTPIARHLLRSSLRAWAMTWAWIGASSGIVLNLLRGPLPAWAATPMYLAMGWGGLICYFGMRQDFSHRRLAMIPLGGALYSIGAAFHLARWPVIWAGVVGPHEVFHLLVIAGAAAHYRFMYRTVARPCVQISAARATRSIQRPAVVRVARLKTPA